MYLPSQFLNLFEKFVFATRLPLGPHLAIEAVNLCLQFGLLLVDLDLFVERLIGFNGKFTECADDVLPCGIEVKPAER